MFAFTPHGADEGMTLVDLLIALGLTLVCVLTLASLLGLSMRARSDARDATVATLLARQKLEVLRAGQSGIVPAPANALNANVPGWFEVVGADGRAPGGVGGTHSRAYVRRWRVAAGSVGTVPVVVLSVRVEPSLSADGRHTRASAVAAVSTLQIPR